MRHRAPFPSVRLVSLRGVTRIAVFLLLAVAIAALLGVLLGWALAHYWLHAI